MSTIAVGIDIETTSLDPTQGEIIEVAAIRFNLKTGAVVNRFEALTAASQPITAEITALTGITSDMLAGRPPFVTVIPDLKKFIGSDTLFAHNAAFDLTWLSAHGCPLANPVWDTFVVAGIAWPEAPSYNLGTLARDLNIAVSGEHRAAADITLTFGVLKAAMASLQISRQVAAHAAHLLKSSNQSHYLPFFSITKSGAESTSTQELSGQSPEETPPTVESLLGDGGLLAKHLPGFQARPQQVALAAYLYEQACSRQSALVEAGAGIGKTYAYLAAGLALGGRLLVSTYTRILQDQLVEKDIPRLLSAAGIRRRVAALKGRRHYVCLERLQSQLKRPQYAPNEAYALLKIVVWLAAGGNGDLERLNFSHQGWQVLRAVHADNPTCRAVCSRKLAADCPYQKARQAASQADITVINHSLLTRWGTGEEQSPDTYRLIVVDEAHHLEDAAIATSACDFSVERVQEITSALSRQLPDQKVKSECQAIVKEYAELLMQARSFLDQHTEAAALRLSRPVRRSAAWNAWASQVRHIVSRLHFTLGLLRAQGESVREAQRLAQELSQYIDPTAPDRVQWLSRHQTKPTASLHEVCFNPQAYVQAILGLGAPVMFLSATLTAGNSFEYMQRRLQLHSLPTNQFAGEFDYQKQMKILAIENGPYPNTDTFDQFVAQQIEQVTLQTKGRLLGLFTSQTSLENVHKSIRSALYKEHIKLFSQGLTGGRHNIAKRFINDEASVLLGSGSFWEGFDSPGETLSVVVIPRLPFPQLGDPVIEALSEQVGKQRAFQEVMLPRMILRFRQGVGRLLRTHSDRGMIIILDRRIVEKEYGRATMHSLPPAPIEILTADKVPAAVSKWFGSETIQRWRNSHAKK